MPSALAVSTEDVTCLEDLLEAVPAGMCAINSQGLVTFVNGAFERIFGYTRSQILRRPVEELLPERYRERHRSHREGFLKEPSQRQMGGRMTLYGLRADGTEFPIEVGLSPLAFKGEALVLASVMDVSIRSHSDDAFRAMVQASPTASLIVSDRGLIVGANARTESVFGYKPTELEDKPLEMLLPERYRDRHPELRAHYLAAPSLREMGSGRDLTALHRDGREVPVEIGLNPVQIFGERMTVVSIVDLTLRKKLELDLRSANANLEEFTYVASHDLKSPLRGIANLVEWIDEDLAAGNMGKVRDNISRVKTRVERMEGIIDDLLRYARAGKKSTEFSRVDPKELVQSILELLPEPEKIKVTLLVDATPLRTAKTPLETALRNLVSNAVKHNDKERCELTVRVTQDNHYLAFAISDNGPGIPAAATDRVFRLFQTLSASERQGSGIGLALTKRLVECHGGEIELASNAPAPGTTFTVRWPRFQRRDLDD